MSDEYLKNQIKTYPNFPKEGILFRDILPILQDPYAFKYLIEIFAQDAICKNSDSLLSIDARGFLIGSALALKLNKPHVVARKPGKLPGELFTEKYNLEYGSDSLSIQKEALDKYNSFTIIDDLLATGGTVECVSKLIYKNHKRVSGLCVVVELKDLKGRSKFNFPVNSIVTF